MKSGMAADEPPVLETERPSIPSHRVPSGVPVPQPQVAVSRARWVLGALPREFRRLFAEPVEMLRRRKLAAIPLSLTATALVALFWLVQQVHGGRHLAWELGGVKATLPVWVALLRTPISLFVPAPDLPVWGALAQVLVVFGLAELLLGRLRTLSVALIVTASATLAARAMIAIGTGSFLGLPEHDAHVLDTGPSVAVVGLLVCIAWVRRAPLLFVVTVVAMASEVAFKPNLAGREHIVGIVAAILCAVFLRRHPKPVVGASGGREGAREWIAGRVRRRGESSS